MTNTEKQNKIIMMPNAEKKQESSSTSRGLLSLFVTPKLVSASSSSSKEELSDFQTLTFKIEDFLHYQGSQFVGVYQMACSDDVDAFGNSWYIRTLPIPDHCFGDEGALEEDDDMSLGGPNYVNCFLQCKSASPDNTVKAVGIIESGPSIYSKTFEHTFTSNDVNGDGFGDDDMILYSDVVSRCLNDDGDWVIKVHLRVYQRRMSTWYPKPLETSEILGKKLLESPIGADIHFFVGESQEPLRAHTAILMHRAPILHELIKSEERRGEEAKFPDLQGSVFKVVLEHIYTGVPPAIVSADLAKQIIVVAHRFGLVYLKLYTESLIVDKLLKTPNDVADWLIYADNHECPLLKEACFKTYKDKQSEVLASSSWGKLHKSSDILSELLSFLASSGNNRNQLPNSEAEYYASMSVGKLRSRLESFGLDLVGTRGMLVERLKDHHSAGGTSMEEDNH